MEVEDSGGKLRWLLCCPGVLPMSRVDAQIVGRVIVGGLLCLSIETQRPPGLLSVQAPAGGSLGCAAGCTDGR